LIQLESAELQAADNVAQAEAQFNFSAAELKCYRELRDKGFISDSHLQEQERQLHIAKSQLATARTGAPVRDSNGVQAREATVKLQEARAARCDRVIEMRDGTIVADAPRQPQAGIAMPRRTAGRAEMASNQRLTCG